MKITVVIPTYNPNPKFFERTVQGLEKQTLDKKEWQLLIIDNASTRPPDQKCLTYLVNARVARERNLGLTHARLRAIKEVDTEFILWVDDDNILEPNYLADALEIFKTHPQLGSIGGPAIPEYQEEPPEWFEPGLAPIGCRDLGNSMIMTGWDTENPTYPDFSPIGAGMVTRTEAIKEWAKAVTGDKSRLALGRTGDALTSGEDNDINLVILRNGWNVGYFPKLKLTHLIPPGRLTLEYQQNIKRVSFRDYIRVLDIHGIRPWPAIPPWTVKLRKLKAYFKLKPRSSPGASIRWHGTCGQFEGQASLSNK